MNRRSFAKSTAFSASLLATGSITRAFAQDSSAEIAPQLPTTFTDDAGNEVVVEDVSRIIPVWGGLTEVVYALGLGDNVVAVDLTALYPPEAQELPQVGYERGLNAEAILSFEPTVVIASTNAGPAEVIDQVRDAGIPVIILESPIDPDGAMEQVRRLGAMLGVPDKGNEVAEAMAAKMEEAAELRADITDEPRVALLMIRGESVQLLFGAHSAGDGLMDAVGAINTGAEAGIQGFQPISPEAMAAAAPDVILTTQFGIESIGGVEGMMQLPGVAETPAGENGNFLAFEELYLLGFGPRTGDLIWDLTLALHPELEGEPMHPDLQGIPEETPAS